MSALTDSFVPKFCLGGLDQYVKIQKWNFVIYMSLVFRSACGYRLLAFDSDYILFLLSLFLGCGMCICLSSASKT